MQACWVRQCTRRNRSSSVDALREERSGALGSPASDELGGVRAGAPAIQTMKTEREEAQKSVAENRKAFHDYHILETFEAGVALLGTEVKSIREGNVNLRDSFARVEGGEVWIYNAHINPYSHRGYADHEPTRRRKLLLRRTEIRKLIGKTVERGMTLVPTRMYFRNGYVKVAISLAKGKKAYDKRETIKRRETERETRAAVKERRSR
jgi:SsrA-binding protein